MLMEWEKGKKDVCASTVAAWQATLWRRIAAGTLTPHRTARHMILIDRLMQPQPGISMERIPARLMLFGISHLPPFHLQVLEALARRIPVYVFLLNPCRHYWFDIVPEHQIIRRRAGRHDIDVAARLHLDRGNRLLASLGLQGQQFFERLHQNDAQVTEAFEDLSSGTLLSCIQQDILDLVDRQRPEEYAEASSIAADGSLCIHCCHSPMREVEVLHDQILEMLAKDEQLQPRDILVMAPDINLYAPYIHAVFGANRDEQQQIPFTITDQNLLKDSPVVEIFVQLLDLANGRFDSPRVLALLQYPAISEKFGISAADLPVVERWIEAVSIRWGWDADERRRQGLPGYRENTWRSGLDRLILGYALAPEGERLFSGILPHDGIGGGEGRIVGCLSAFVETLHLCLMEMDGRDSIEGWHSRLKRWVDRLFIANDEKAPESRQLRTILEQLVYIRQAIPDSPTVPFDIIRAWIKNVLRQTTREAGFMAGGVTFCAMLPMRSIPAQAICLLGMNYDAYPRDHRLPGFDLIALEPRPGDRSKRYDDRYLFLEALISARKTFYISYVGRDIEDNSSIPPSVVVDELLEYASEGFGISGERLVTKHPLHGFSRAYFDSRDPQLFSFSEENKEAAELLPLEAKERSFFMVPLMPPQTHWQNFDWEHLCAFFAHPSRYLLEQRLGLRIKATSNMIENREPFTLNALDRYRINHRILKAKLAGKSLPETFEVTKAAGMLPHGTAGRVLYETLGDEVAEYLRTLDLFLPKEKPREVFVQVVLPPFCVDGALNDIYTDARVVCRLGKVRPQDLLHSFICHLALALTTNRSIPETTILICKDAVWRFGPVEQPESVFQDYLNLYWIGLQAPLPFFCRTSFEYAQQLLIYQREPLEAMGFAIKTWIGNEYIAGEGADPYYERCFGPNPPLGPEFEKLAMRVFRPLFCAGEKLPVGN